MVVVFVVLAAVVLFAAVMVVLGRGDLLEPDVPLGTERLLPDGAVGADDVNGVRFAVVQRGYRMDQVDSVLDRLEGELDWRDRRIAELESRLPGLRPAGAAPPPGPAAGMPLPRRRPVPPGAPPGTSPGASSGAPGATAAPGE
ncbi:DivIVA domain-containing protein [Jiangella asiatica]|nr:DivIVA domain-containing protein [Jiangella asiatica]